MPHPFRGLPADHKVQLYTQAMHVGIVVLICVGATILGLLHDIRSVDTVTIYGTALGYAGGAASAATRGRSNERRSSDAGTQETRT